MKMNDIDGLIFVSDYILEHKDPNFDFRHYLYSMTQLTNAESLPFLMKLLRLGKEKEFQKDSFNNLESLVIDTIYRIGIESDQNFTKVHAAITNFIEVNSAIIKHLNFLHFTVARIEQQLNMNKSKSYNIHQAIEEWEKSI
jgi:ABC-type enterochelin transport system permease subunit